MSEKQYVVVNTQIRRVSLVALDSNDKEFVKDDPKASAENLVSRLRSGDLMCGELECRAIGDLSVIEKAVPVKAQGEVMLLDDLDDMWGVEL